MNTTMDSRRPARHLDRTQIKEATETRTILFEWPLTNLKHHFDSSKSDSKSKVIKSVPFGGGRWTVLFYAQSGVDQFCSLYLNAEPLPEERVQHFDGKSPAATVASDVHMAKEDKWAREGAYGFTFKIETLDRTTTLGSKEAHDHAFSDKTSNWGWAQFAKRDAVFYNSNNVRHADAFLISVSVIENPNKPRIHRPLGHTVPPVLIQAMGSLLDDPDHSDIVFVIHPRRSTPGGRKRPKQKVYAIKKILAARCEYFRDMFGGGYMEAETVESSEDEGSMASQRSFPSNDHHQSPQRGQSSRSSAAAMQNDPETLNDDLDPSDALLDDSDEELEFVESQKLDLSYSSDKAFAQKIKVTGGAHNASSEGEDEHEDEDDDDDFADEDEVIAVSGASGSATVSSAGKPRDGNFSDPSPSLAGYRPGYAADISVSSVAKDDSESKDQIQKQLASIDVQGSSTREEPMEYSGDGSSSRDSVGQNTKFAQEPLHVRQGLQKRSRASTLETYGARQAAKTVSHKKRRKVHFPEPRVPKTDSHRYRVQVVRDSAYLTFKALLYYLYTDTVEFSPLTSSFLSSDAAADESSSESYTGTLSERNRWGSTTTETFTDEMRKAHEMRKNHITSWRSIYPDKPTPCSAKAMYRLADKLQIPDLKRRAQEHIANSLTVKNIVWEVFSGFNTQFKDIRKIETDFLLKHWMEVKKSKAMKTIFHRADAHPGLAEVWPYLLSQLEYRANPEEGSVEASDSE